MNDEFIDLSCMQTRSYLLMVQLARWEIKYLEVCCKERLALHFFALKRDLFVVK